MNYFSFQVADSPEGTQKNTGSSAISVPTATEGNKQIEADDILVADDDPRKADKRNFGRWRNANWMHGKRNFGRWKNRRWVSWQQLFDDTQSYPSAVHSLSKRFSDFDGVASDVIPGPYQGYDEISPFIVDPSFLSDDFDDDLTMESDDSESADELDKRHASRWKYIHRKLASLDNESKRDIERFVDKRMNSRWRLIQNKLNELNGDVSKRFAGRWRNQNWLLGKINSDDSEDFDSYQKRNFGRWKNRNWILRKFSAV